MKNEGVQIKSRGSLEKTKVTMKNSYRFDTLWWRGWYSEKMLWILYEEIL